MEEKDKSYNPADYKALEDKAKAMNRKELENYYVVDKDKRYIPIALGLILLIAVSALIFAIWMLGTLNTGANVNMDLSKNIIDLQEEICPLIGDYEFTIQEKRTFFGLREIEINCEEYK